MMKPLHVLAFAPHPDDAEASCGGTLLSLSRRGYRVGICDLTQGELGSNGDAATRQLEAAEAARHLELSERWNLGLPDGCLSAGDIEQTRQVVDAVRLSSPRIIIAPHRHSRHPDHAEATRLIERARFFCGLKNFTTQRSPVERPTLLYALDYHPMKPHFVVDITNTLEAKMAALRCYRSQFESDAESVPTLLNDPAYLKRIETNARTYGQLIETPAGEPFQSERTLRLEDLVEIVTYDRKGVRS